jgi:prophage regulatory protein
MMQERMLNVKEVAKMLGVSKSTVYNLINEGKLPRPILITERLRRWKLSDILNYIEKKAGSAA